jgi:glycerol-3-phosphate cytidylyltransferase-like family protein
MQSLVFVVGIATYLHLSHGEILRYAISLSFKYLKGSSDLESYKGHGYLRGLFPF